MNIKIKIEIVILLLALTINLFSQNGLKKIGLNKNYSWKNHSQDELNEYYFGIKPIKDSKKAYHFRFQKFGQIIDLYSNDGIDFTGELINEITEYKQVKSVYGKNEIPKNYVFELVNLESTTSNRIAKIILQQELYSIPTDKLIDNWNFGWMDCGKVNFGFKVEDKFYSTTYTCLWNQQDTINYIKQIKKIYDYFIQIFDLQTKYSSFESRLEKGKTYSSDGFILQYLFTKRETDKWNQGKPQRDYQKSIKDTINRYLDFKLNELITDADKLDCLDIPVILTPYSGDIDPLKVVGSINSMN